MSRVLFTPQVRKYFNTLIPVLYKLEYFSYLDGSKKYVKGLIDDIIAGLPTCLHKPAPPYFDKYGRNTYYAMFRKNKQTVWYVFFTLYDDNGDTVYLVRYIANNHVVAQHL